MNMLQLLKSRNIPFDEIEHPASYTAAALSHKLDCPPQKVAKTVLLHADQRFTDVVAVVPADRRVDLERVGKALGGATLELASEADVAQHCPDCEPGVLPPFGSQYGMQTIVDKQLAECDEIVFEGTTHDHAIRMRFADFRQVENPLIAPIAGA